MILNNEWANAWDHGSQEIFFFTPTFFDLRRRLCQQRMKEISHDLAHQVVRP